MRSPRAIYDDPEDLSVSADPGMVLLGSEVFDDEAEAILANWNRRLRIGEHERLTLALSPYTAQHLRERRHCYHRLNTGRWAGLENGPATSRRKAERTFFKPLEILCTQTSSTAVAAGAPCALCDLRKQLAGTMTTGSMEEELYYRLEPIKRYVLEVGVLARDGTRTGRARCATSFIELGKRAFWLISELAAKAGKVQFELRREKYGLELEWTSKPIKENQHNFGNVVIVQPMPDSFVRELAETLQVSKGVWPEQGRAEQLRDLLPGAVFVPTWNGTKHPMKAGFFDFAPRWMDQWEDYALVLDSGNIQIICGPKSDNLCSIDFDTIHRIQDWLNFNRWAGKAIKVHGRRGFSVLFRLKGDYPARVIKITASDGSSGIGEMRLGKCLQMVSGLHPSGQMYRLEGDFLPEISFDEIVPAPWWDDFKTEEENVRPRILRRDRCELDLEKLSFVQDCGKWLDAQCPSCKEHGKDTNHDNLRVWKGSWGFKCIAGCSRDEILGLAARADNDQNEESIYEQQD